MGVRSATQAGQGDEDGATDKPVPKVSLLPGVANAAESWDVAVAHATPDDRAYLEFVQEKYPGIVEFDDEEGRALLEKLSIPLPEEWLAAKRLSDAELEAMMKHGDLRATTFYADRMTDRLQEILDEAGTQDVTKVYKVAPHLMDRFGDAFVKATTSSSIALRRNPSAFTVYVYGREGAVTGNAKFVLAASYEAAYDLGDPRAPDFLRRFEAVNGDLSPGAILDSYKQIRTTVGM